jgi:hypothetical protein
VAAAAARRPHEEVPVVFVEEAGAVERGLVDVHERGDGVLLHGELGGGGLARVSAGARGRRVGALLAVER